MLSLPAVKYPKPGDYRNPYVVRRRGRRPGPRARSLRPGSSAARVIELAGTGDYATMKAIGDVVGISRERVRQIIRQHEIFWQDARVLLEWECPGCGKWISVPRSEWESQWNHMPAHCRSCSQEEKERFCIRGHLRSEHMSSAGLCRACARLKSACVVEVRSCEICRQPLTITDGMRREAQYGRALNKYHRRCWIRKLATSNRRTHCKRGHEFTEENTYRWRGTRQCRACYLLRYHARASK